METNLDQQDQNRIVFGDSPDNAYAKSEMKWVKRF